MSNDDSYFRELEKRFKQTGVPEDERAYLVEGARLGRFLETGFLYRMIDDQRQCPKLRIRLPGMDVSYSLERLTESGNISDFSFADDSIHIQTSPGLRRRKNRVHSITASGKVRMMRLPLGTNLISVNGEFGYVSRGAVYVRGAKVHMSEHGHVMAYTPTQGYVSHSGGISSSHFIHCSLQQPFAVSSAYPIFHVFNHIFSVLERTDSEKRPSPPSESRLGKDTWITTDRTDLESAWTPFHGTRIIEVPRRNIDGLLLALDRFKEDGKVDTTSQPQTTK